jgi:hypothetical protein
MILFIPIDKSKIYRKKAVSVTVVIKIKKPVISYVFVRKSLFSIDK